MAFFTGSWTSLPQSVGGPRAGEIRGGSSVAEASEPEPADHVAADSRGTPCDRGDQPAASSRRGEPPLPPGAILRPGIDSIYPPSRGAAGGPGPFDGRRDLPRDVRDQTVRNTHAQG
jgi:hypothetical protein